MKCSHCEEEVQEDDEVCPHCQKEIQTKEEHTESDEEVLNESTSDSESSFEEDVALFVGDNYPYYQKKWEKVKKKNGITFNVAGFFLSFLWLGYRKMYKIILFFALGFLAVDLLLYIFGYQYDPNEFISPIDRGISTGVTITFLFYANMLYKSHTEKSVKLIRRASSGEEKKALLKEKGGTSWLGVLFSVLILVGVYLIPTMLIPMNMDETEIVKQSDFYDLPGVPVEELFDETFESGEWEYEGEEDGEDVVTYTGEFADEYEEHDVIITFYADETEDLDLTIEYDDEFLYLEEVDEFLEEVFDRYEE